MWYAAGVVLGLYCAWFEYYIEKQTMKFDDFLQALWVCILCWYIMVPWIIGDYIYTKLLKERKWPFLHNKKN